MIERAKRKRSGERNERREGGRKIKSDRDKSENKTQPQKIVINILGAITEDTVSMYQESLI